MGVSNKEGSYFHLSHFCGEAWWSLLCWLPFSSCLSSCSDAHKANCAAIHFHLLVMFVGMPKNHFVLATFSIVWFYRGMRDEAKCVGSHFNCQICVWHEWSICFGLSQLSCAHYMIILHHLVYILGGYKGFILCVVCQMNNMVMALLLAQTMYISHSLVADIQLTNKAHLRF